MKSGSKAAKWHRKSDQYITVCNCSFQDMYLQVGTFYFTWILMKIILSLFKPQHFAQWPTILRCCLVSLVFNYCNWPKPFVKRGRIRGHDQRNNYLGEHINNDHQLLQKKQKQNQKTYLNTKGRIFFVWTVLWVLGLHALRWQVDRKSFCGSQTSTGEVVCGSAPHGVQNLSKWWNMF